MCPLKGKGGTARVLCQTARKTYTMINQLTEVDCTAARLSIAYCVISVSGPEIQIRIVDALANLISFLSPLLPLSYPSLKSI